MALLLEKIQSSFAKIFDAAQPADVAEIRKRVLSASQRDNLIAIRKDHRELNAKLDAYRFPSKRLEVLLWRHGYAKLEDAPDDIRLAIEKVVYEGDPREILRQDEVIRERAGAIAARAQDAIRDANKTFIPHLKAEIEKIEALLTPIFEKYQCCHEIPDTGPMRRLARSLSDSETAVNGYVNANGAFIPGDFDLAHLEREFAGWLGE